MEKQINEINKFEKPKIEFLCDFVKDMNLSSNIGII